MLTSGLAHDRPRDRHPHGSGMLTALRLPSFHKLWAEIASRADTEGWPAARFLAVLAE